MSSPGRSLILSFVLIALGTLGATAAGRAQTVRLHGMGGEIDWPETPVVLPIKSGIKTGTHALEDLASGSRILASVFEEGGSRWFAAVLPSVAAGKPFSYELKPSGATEPSHASGVTFRPSGPNLDVMIDDGLLTTYWPKSGSKPIFFPLIGPTGDPITRAYPMLDVPGEDHDHPHQRSFWFTHGSVNGIDFWAEEPRGGADGRKTKGTIRELSRTSTVEGPVLGRLRTHDEWLAPDGHKVCEDHRTVTFYRTRAVRIIDFEIVIEATAGPVTFGDTKEGMFGLRLASSMDVKRKKGGKITNAEGLTDDRTWGKASPWVDYVGPVNGKTVGVAIINHPRSFRFPTTWHVRDYGLFAANPFGWKDFGRKERGDHTVPAGESLRFAYRIILHPGDTPSLGAPGYFQAYHHASVGAIVLE